jgi:hypothetical protein
MFGTHFASFVVTEFAHVCDILREFEMMKRLFGIGLFLIAATAVGADEPRKEVVVKDVRGQIVRVDPATNIVVVRTGEGETVKEFEYQVNTTTKYWDPNQAVVTDGLRYKGFRPGATVWYRLGTGDNSRYLTELRFYDPVLIKGKP